MTLHLLMYFFAVPVSHIPGSGLKKKNLVGFAIFSKLSQHRMNFNFKFGTDK